jgi:hypothetical protein
MEESVPSRILLVAALALSLVVVPAATGQSGKKTRDVNGTVHMAAIGPYGSAGTTYAGEFVGKPARRSALIVRSTVEGTTATGKVVQYAKHGTIRATTRNEVQPQPDGSVRFPGTFEVTGGTGRYKGATGSGTFDGVLPAESTIFEITLKGKIRY